MVTKRVDRIPLRSAAKQDTERQIVAFLRVAGWISSAEVAKHMGCPVIAATKRLVSMRQRGMVIRLGVVRALSTWAPSDDEAAIKQAARDAVAPRKRPRRKSFVGNFVHRVVPAKSRKMPLANGPRSVFDVGRLLAMGA